MSSDTATMTAEKGYKVTEVGVSPDEWEVVKFRDFTQIYRGASPRPIQDPRWFSDCSGIGWIRIADVTKSKKYLLETSQYLSSEGVSKSRFVDKGKLIMSICGTIGRPIILKTPSCIHDGFIVFEDLDKKQTQVEFLYYWLAYNEHYFQKQGQKGTQANINTDIVKITPIALPPLPEQEKIAEVLSTMDEHIGETEDLIEKTETLKQGMMQRLLTQGIGHTEFKDTEIGRIPAEWEVVSTGSLGSTYNGLTGKNKDDFGSSGYPFITYKAIFDSSTIDLSRFEFVRVGEKEKQNEVIQGDLFFTTSSETPDEVGMCSALLHRVDRVYLNSFCFGYRIHDQSSFDPNYARFFFRGKYFRHIIAKIAQGSTRYNLSKIAMMKINIPLPSIFEQKLIADILTTIDAQIEEYRSKLERLNQLKSGLMQQLLTGRIRVQM